MNLRKILLLSSLVVAMTVSAAPSGWAQTQPVTVDTASYNLAASDFANSNTRVMNSVTAQTYTLLATAPTTNGQHVQLLNVNSGLLTISRNGRLINGLSVDVVCNTGQSVVITTDGTNYTASGTCSSSSVSTGTNPPTPTPGTAGGITFGNGTGPQPLAGNTNFYGDGSLICGAVNSNNTGSMCVSRILPVNVTPVTTALGTTADHNLMAVSGGLLPNLLNVAGRRIKSKGQILFSTAAAYTLNAKLALCTASDCSTTVLNLCSITSTATVGASTNNPINFECEFATQTAGASAVFEYAGSMDIVLGASPAGTSARFHTASQAVSGAIDSTVQLYLMWRGAFGTANAGNSFTQRLGSAEVTN